MKAPQPTSAWLLPMLIAALTLTACEKQQPRPLLSEDYEGWGSTTRLILDYPVPGHENRGRRIFINTEGTEATTRSEGGRVFWDYPPGTIVLKEIYANLDIEEGERPIMLTGMVKDPEHPRARGGWIWVVKDLGSGSEQIIDWEFCVDCHANANEPHPYGDRNEDNEFRDYVFFPYRRP
jgi:hypothetical protein